MTTVGRVTANKQFLKDRLIDNFISNTFDTIKNLFCPFCAFYPNIYVRDCSYHNTLQPAASCYIFFAKMFKIRSLTICHIISVSSVP